MEYKQMHKEMSGEGVAVDMNWAGKVGGIVAVTSPRSLGMSSPGEGRSSWLYRGQVLNR